MLAVYIERSWKYFILSISLELSLQDCSFLRLARTVPLGQGYSWRQGVIWLKQCWLEEVEYLLI